MKYQFEQVNMSFNKTTMAICQRIYAHFRTFAARYVNFMFINLVKYWPQNLNLSLTLPII